MKRPRRPKFHRGQVVAWPSDVPSPKYARVLGFYYDGEGNLRYLLEAPGGLGQYMQEHFPMEEIVRAVTAEEIQ